MSRLGFGAGRFRSKSQRRKPVPVSIPLALLAPSPAWTGPAGSGFSAVPVDPARTTAKPACRLIVPPNQRYTDELLVGVTAWANDNGSLLNTCGLSKVIAHYEGTSIDILEPSFQTFNDANGTPRTYFGWWIKLKRDGRNGAANLYFEAIPRNSAMQNRVIGPYAFHPNSTLYDAELTIAPSLAVVAGSRYQTIVAALDYCRLNSRNFPHITITEPGTYDIGSMAMVFHSLGYAVIDATVAVTIGKAAYTTDINAGMRSRWDPMCFRGSNVTIDMVRVSEIYRESPSNRQHWLDGCNLTNSAGRYSLWRKGTRILAWNIRAGGWFTEVAASNINDPYKGASLVRGGSSTSGWNDVATDALCVIGHTCVDHNAAVYRTEIPAMTVTYGGAGATATFELSGGNNASSRTFTAKVDGASVGTFTVGNTQALFDAGTNYDVADVVAWINTLSGWTATLLNDTRLAASLSLAGINGTAFAAQNVKGVSLTLVTMFDTHSDWYQQNSTGPAENVVAVDNISTLGAMQNIFVNGSASIRDFVFVNNAFDNLVTAAVSQIDKAHSHVVIAHTSSSQQGLTMIAGTYNPDAYCLTANNALPSLTWTAGTPDADVVIKGNHLFAGATNPANGTGTTTGGTKATLFADAANADFTPQGALLANLKPPVASYDRSRKRRGPAAPAGA